MSFGYYKSTPSVASQKETAMKRLKQLMKKDKDTSPIEIEGSKIAKSWWGKSWCSNLERYADYENRIGRGRSYVRNGFVLDLRISEGRVEAKVSGSRLYDVVIEINKLSESKWNKISSKCAKRIESIAVLAEGKFPKELEEIFMMQGEGLFPSPKEIRLDCSCPDYAVMCKHVAAVLYAIGAKLDQDPLLFFTLRGIDATELIKKSVDDKMKSLLQNAEKRSSRTIDDEDISRIFGM